LASAINKKLVDMMNELDSLVVSFSNVFNDLKGDSDAFYRGNVDDEEESGNGYSADAVFNKLDNSVDVGEFEKIILDLKREYSKYHHLEKIPNKERYMEESLIKKAESIAVKVEKLGEEKLMKLTFENEIATCFEKANAAQLEMLTGVEKLIGPLKVIAS